MIDIEHTTIALTGEVKLPAFELLEGVEEDDKERLHVESRLLGSADHLSMLSVGEANTDRLKATRSSRDIRMSVYRFRGLMGTERRLTSSRKKTLARSFHAYGLTLVVRLSLPSPSITEQGPSSMKRPRAEEHPGPGKKGRG